jgi:hypothetical protein
VRNDSRINFVKEIFESGSVPNIYRIVHQRWFSSYPFENSSPLDFVEKIANYLFLKKMKIKILETKKNAHHI